MIIRDRCPQCGSQQYKKNGHIHNGKQNYRCSDCGRQFVGVFEQHLISEEHRTLIERLLLERLSLHGICRAVGGDPLHPHPARGYGGKIQEYVGYQEFSQRR